MSLPIIYTHYGDTDYLARTLAAASITNPEKRRILIGDSTNRHTAQLYGWEHVDMNICTSILRDDFSRNFKIIKGKFAVTEKGNRNWAKYVIERWFAVHAFIQIEKIDSFWHFDSDVVIAKPLISFEQALDRNGIDYTRQCDGACLNGYVRSPVVDDYCRSIVELFNNDDRLQAFQRRYDESEPHHVLTEMEAFTLFAKESSCKGCHLEAYFPDIWFDDTMRRDDGCDTVRMEFFGPIVKDMVFDGTEFFVTQNNKKELSL